MSNKLDNNYKLLLAHVVNKGFKYTDESRGVEMSQLETATISHNLMTDGFPILTLKEVHFKSVVAELIWFLRGGNEEGLNIKFLRDRNVNIWNKDAYKYAQRNGYKGTMEEFLVNIGEKLPNGFTLGNVGKVYGYLWRNFRGVDQLFNLIESIMDRPNDRRKIVTAWDPSNQNCALPPCHYLFEVVTTPISYFDRLSMVDSLNETQKGTLMKEYALASGEKKEEIKKEIDGYLENIPTVGIQLEWLQRSVDTFLGLPFNISSYGILTLFIAKMTGTKGAYMRGQLRNVHVYKTHQEPVQEFFKRKPMHPTTSMYFDRTLEKNIEIFRSLPKEKRYEAFCDIINTLDVDSFQLLNYQHQGKIKAEMVEPLK